MLDLITHYNFQEQLYPTRSRQLVVSLLLTTMTLTELLPSIRQLSAIDKRELIRILMAEEDISDERAWKAKFEATRDAQWDSLAEMVRQEITVMTKPPQSPYIRAHTALEIPR